MMKGIGLTKTEIGTKLPSTIMLTTLHYSASASASCDFAHVLREIMFGFERMGANRIKEKEVLYDSNGDRRFQRKKHDCCCQQ